MSSVLIALKRDMMPRQWQVIDAESPKIVQSPPLPGL
jgi:hypothetical protein